MKFSLDLRFVIIVYFDSQLFRIFGEGFGLKLERCLVDCLRLVFYVIFNILRVIFLGYEGWSKFCARSFFLVFCFVSRRKVFRGQRGICQFLFGFRGSQIIGSLLWFYWGRYLGWIGGLGFIRVYLGFYRLIVRFSFF